MLLCLLSGCRWHFEVAGDNNLDDADAAVLTVIDANRIDALDASTANLCAGWTYCDDFEGNPTAGWSLATNGVGATMALSTVRAKSGARSLRGIRANGRGEPDYASWKVTAKLTECDYDIYLVDTFSSGGAEVEVSYFRVTSPQYQVFEPGQSVFKEDKFFGAWEYVDNAGASRSGETVKFAVSINQWLHVTMKVGMSGVNLASMTIEVAGPGSNADTMLLPNLPYDTMTFGIGLYEDKTNDALEAFFDNVRCR
jgi:hypothetical protein